MTGANTTSNDRLAIAREYERQHLGDMIDMAQRANEVLFKEFFVPAKERIKKFADTLAERIDLKDPMLDITEKKQISAYIKQKYREHEVPEGIVHNVNNHLPDEYKNKALEREHVIEQQTNGTNFSTDSTPEIKKLDNLRLQDRDEFLEERRKKLKAEMALVNDEQAILHEEASERRLSLPSMRSQVISTPKPQAGDTEFSTALIDIANLYQEVARKVIEFPPSPQDAERYARAARTHIQILTPFTDLKYTKGPKGWLKTILDFDAWGKHAAAVKNAVQTPSGVNRPLTREQVGDKVEEVLQGAIDMIESDHLLKSLSEHHERYIEPHVAQRKVNLHDTLSEKA